MKGALGTDPKPTVRVNSLKIFATEQKIFIGKTPPKGKMLTHVGRDLPLKKFEI